jgi:NAD(P)-dependent dehydrogenase (short-subunit alcohol dehydrogenase family)
VGVKVALVTGAAGAIGKAIALGLARQPDFEVILVGRDRERIEAAANEVRRASGNARVRGETADLSRLAEIRALAARHSGPLDVLVNNAATAPRRREETPEGIERQLATNVLSYLWMAEAFEQALALAAPSRIVNVASYWAGDLELDDLEFCRRAYDNDTAYRQSKQANRMLTVAQAEALAERRIAVNACHPGDVNSKLSSDLGFGGSESPEAGAKTPLMLAAGEGLDRISGKYFEHGRQKPCKFARDRRAIAALAERCAAYGSAHPARS